MSTPLAPILGGERRREELRDTLRLPAASCRTVVRRSRGERNSVRETAFNPLGPHSWGREKKGRTEGHPQTPGTPQADCTVVRRSRGEGNSVCETAFSPLAPHYWGREERGRTEGHPQTPGSVPLHRLVSCLHSPCRCSEGHASSWPQKPVVGGSREELRDTLRLPAKGLRPSAHPSAI